MKNKPIVETGSESSFWRRSMRILFDHGKPLSPMTLLACRIPPGSTHLFGCVTQTAKGRLVFWPPLPRAVPLLSADGRRGVTDHVTLELANRTSHVTSYNAAGKPNRHRDGWVLDGRGGCSLSLWFTLFVPFSILREQDHAVTVNVPMPATDTGRRVEEFTKYAASCPVETLEPPPHEFSGDYLYCMFYLQTGEELTTEGLQVNPRQQGLDGLVAGFRDDVPIASSTKGLQVGDSRVIILSAAPPGTATADVMCGFPTRSPGAAGH
jgi:hypothetical protein